MDYEVKLLIADIEQHCNNYFNPHNDPDSLIRNYPANFIELVGRIEQYEKTVQKDNITSFANEGYSENRDLESSSWQKAFARELSIYKRAKFI